MLTETFFDYIIIATFNQGSSKYYNTLDKKK